MELDGKNHKFSQFLVDLLLISNKTCHLTPSVCAVVATMMSRKYKNKGDFVWTKYDKALTGYSCEDVKSAIRDLARSLLNIGGSHAKYDASEVCVALSGMKDYLFKKYDDHFDDLKTYLDKHRKIPEMIIKEFK